MRMLGREGANVLEAGGEMSGLWEEIRTIFGYGCEDEADDWWVQWGLLRERAGGFRTSEQTPCHRTESLSLDAVRELS